ncbi:MAG: sigma-54-dependent transcriptional regulator [Thermodesulfobacteriota bacterium]
MIDKNYNLLLVDDEEINLDLLHSTFRGDYNTYMASNGEMALKVLKDRPIDLIIADQRMPGLSGLDLLAKVRYTYPDTIRILITGYTDMDIVIDSINKGGIHRYIKKPWDPDDLKWVIDQELSSYKLILKNRELTKSLRDSNKELGTLYDELKEAKDRLSRENLYLRREVEKGYNLERIIGNSKTMDKVFKLMKQVITTDATVMITGETGTGKNLIARTIHYNGYRKNKVLFTQNCGELSETLLESELFGHRKGAFTGAVEDKKGIFEIADGGTIFLDEIGETSHQMQIKLLRVIEAGEIKPVGGIEYRKVDVRIISATNKDIKKEVKKGNFREDLFYRLNVFPIDIPPLRKRRDDIPLLIVHFLEECSKRLKKKIRGINRECMKMLITYQWPGNVRELRNEIERAVTLTRKGKSITPDILSGHIRGVKKVMQIDEDRYLKDVVGELEQQMIRDVLKRHGGNKSRSARELGLSRVGLHKKLKRYGIEA